MLIMNERQFVEDCISGKLAPAELKIGRARMISLLSAYFGNEKQNIQYIIALMGDFYQENFLQGQWVTLIERIVRTQAKHQTRLIERDYIPIYQSDINLIHSLKSEKQRKLMFAAIVLARYQNKEGWIGLYKSTDIKRFFDLANVAVSPMQRYLMIGELEKNGYLIGANKNDNINERVVIENDGVEVMQIRTLENLGNQYLGRYKSGWRMCECCMKMFKIRTSVGRPQKYCRACSLAVHKRQDREYQRKKRQEIDKKDS